jgi:hypothetical protein
MTYFVGSLICFTIWELTLGSQNEINKDGPQTCNNQVECESKQNFDELDELNRWANNLPVLKQQDASIVNHMKDLVRQQRTNPLLTDEAVIDHFQRIMALPLQTACHVGKYVSLKRWLHRCGAMDGQRYLCMDNFYRDIHADTCIIYSFGISEDYEFERDMGSIGCVVHAYDPTIDLPSSPAKNVHFNKVGLGHTSGKMTMTVSHEQNRLSKPLPAMTLKEHIEKNGDLGKEITYVKVDIESAEIKAIPEWIESGILQNVRQIGIELHTGKIFFDKAKRARVAESLLKSISQLYDLGFRHISYDPNTCVGKSQDHDGRYYTFIDIVLYKPYNMTET